MPIELQIRKKAGNVWIYTHGGKDYSSSRQHLFAKDSQIRFTEPIGNQFADFPLSECAIYDDSDAGTEETYPTVAEFTARLKELKNPSYSQECDGDVNGGTA